MNRNHEPNIDELLSSFIDGELSKRQQIKVQRLIAHEPKVVHRLRQLQKTKMLVSSLPHAEAPPELPAMITAALQKRTILPAPAYGAVSLEYRRGATHLLVRKVVAAAAMISLIAILGAVVYTIISPEKGAAVGFNGRLELKTAALTEVDQFISGAIEKNALLECTGPKTRESKRVYALTGSRTGLNLLLNNLEEVWPKFDSATLVVQTETAGQKVVNASSAQHITDLITPVKPRITSQEDPSARQPVQSQDAEKVHLTIVITSSEQSVSPAELAPDK